MEKLSIEVVENATKTVSFLPETPFEKVLADCMTDYLEMRKAEEQGLLLRLPCKVGDKVFYVDSIRKFIDECEIRRIKCKSLDERHMGITLEMIGSLWHCVRAELIGNGIFLTKEEAEQALKQMGE